MHTLFKLKLRYQVLLLWLPVALFLGGVALGMYVSGVLLGPGMGINLEQPIAEQARGAQFFWSIVFAGLITGTLAAIASYAVTAGCLRWLLRMSWLRVKSVLRGSGYPESWS